MGLFITAGDDILLIDLFSMVTVTIEYAIPSYLRFGKFLVRLSHDGQEHTCRKCNCLGHFANDCPNTFCFNCEELGHKAESCPSLELCCICKHHSHRARYCPYSWYRQPSPLGSPTQSAHPKARISRSQLMTSLSENQNKLAWLSSCQLLLMSPPSRLAVSLESYPDLKLEFLLTSAFLIPVWGGYFLLINWAKRKVF